ncbi:MAG: ABC transporter ATP-binding protein [Bacteroidia bacterium]|nr:ABC transporter ATP-binding protein [Bacteroidia bacterium]MCZ2277931.1 ABC transporter ATP-binding protein [Bacteroidia bacterium]
MTSVIKTHNLVKYFNDPVLFKVIKNISFEITKGEFVSVIGKSGSGKSTLLYILATMDSDYQGELLIEGETVSDKTEKERAYIRNKKIGFVFQFHYLLNEFSVLRNVMLPALKAGEREIDEIEQKAFEKLKLLGMESHANKKPHQLSGGEKQRVAIARSLINDPLIIMADEPTGNLDKHNSEIVFEIFGNLASAFNQTLLIVTHDIEFASRTHRIIELEDGRILFDRRN